MVFCRLKKIFIYNCMKKVIKYINPLKLLSILYQVLKEKNGIRKLLGLILVYSRLCYLFTIKRNGYILKFFPTALSVTFFQDKEAWRYEEVFLEKYLRPNDVIIDVGANIGNVGIRAAALFDSCKVYMIEAHPQVYKFMKANVELNELNNVISFNLAVGNSDNELIKFSNHLSDDLNSVLSAGDDGIYVKMNKLDSLINEEKVDFLKVDVEGFEFDVFKGSNSLLDKISCIMFESWDSHFSKYNTNSKIVLDFLRSKGFSILKWREDVVFEIESEHRSLICENLLAVKDIKVFRDRLSNNI